MNLTLRIIPRGGRCEGSRSTSSTKTTVLESIVSCIIIKSIKSTIFTIDTISTVRSRSASILVMLAVYLKRMKAKPNSRRTRGSSGWRISSTVRIGKSAPSQVKDRKASMVLENLQRTGVTITSYGRKLALRTRNADS